MNRLACAFFAVILLTIPVPSQTARRRARPRPKPTSARPMPLSAEDYEVINRSIGRALQEGVKASRAGETNTALAYYQTAVLLARQHRLFDLEAIALNNLALLWLNVGEQKGALDNARQALSVSRAAGLREQEARSLGLLGSITKRSGDTRQALGLYEQALTIQDDIGAEGAADTLNNMGMLFAALDDAERAMIHYRRALLANSRTADMAERKGLEAAVLNNLASIYEAKGDRRQAIEHYQRALAINRENGDARGEAHLLNNLGTLYFATGEHDQAFAHYEQALVIHRRTADRPGEVNALRNIAHLCYKKTGETDCALELLRAAAVVCERMKDARCSAEVKSDVDALHKLAGRRD